MFSTLNDIVNNNKNFGELFEKIAELLNGYTQSQYIIEECVIEYVFPIFSKILAD